MKPEGEGKEDKMQGKLKGEKLKVEQEKGRCAKERSPGAERGPSRRPNEPRPPEPRREIGNPSLRLHPFRDAVGGNPVPTAGFTQWIPLRAHIMTALA